MSGAIPLLPLYVFMAWTGESLLFADYSMYVKGSDFLKTKTETFGNI